MIEHGICAIPVIKIKNLGSSGDLDLPGHLKYFKICIEFKVEDLAKNGGIWFKVERIATAEIEWALDK